MNSDPTGKDPLERLLGSQPVRPSPGFTEKTLARLRAEGTEKLSEEELDRRLDAWLADRPAAASEDFSRRVLAAATASRPVRRFLGLPVWVGGLAAALAIGGFTTFAVLREQPSPQPQTFAEAEELSPVAGPKASAPLMAKMSVAADTAPVANRAAPSARMMAVASTPLAVEEVAVTEEETPDFLFVSRTDAETDELADLILMQDALVEVAALSDADTIEALDLLVN